MWALFLVINVGVPIKHVRHALKKNIVWALLLPSNVGTFSSEQYGDFKWDEMGWIGLGISGWCEV